MDYKRDSGIRFSFSGLKTNATADAMPRGKFPFAENIRSYADNYVQTRPPMQLLYPSVGSATLALEPTLGVYNVGTSLLRAGGVIDTGYSGLGCSLIPFRPNASPFAYEYVFDSAKATKVLATIQNVGIAEPQSPIDASIGFAFPVLAGATILPMIHAGVASLPVTASRIADTAFSVYPDPANPNLVSVEVSTTQIYTKLMTVNFYSGSTDYGEVQVTDVFPYQPHPITISAIYYYAGTTGRCVIVPAGMSGGPGTEGQSIYAENFLSSLRRGTIINLNDTGETCYVLDVTQGPSGGICFEVVTFQHHAAGITFTCLPCIQVTGTSAAAGRSINSPSTVSFNLSGSGIGTVTSAHPLTPGLFTTAFGASTTSFQPEDYIHFSVNVQFLASLNEIKILLDCGDGSFTENFYYYTIRQADIEAGIQNTLTQLGSAQIVEQRAIIDEEQSISSARNQGTTVSGDQTTPGDGQWSEIAFPISALTRVGSSETATLQNINACQYLFNVNADTNISITDFDVFGGGQCDVDSTGAPMRYWIRPRSSITGAKGNPSPAMRYGVNPRRQTVNVYVPLTYSDPQVDTWDIFRDGGSLDAPRLVGNLLIGTSGTFIDNYSDDAITANELLEYDNLEPFPTISNSLNGTVTGGAGTAIVVTTSMLSAALIENLLPGNEIQIGQQLVYTLWTRPTLLSSGVYLFQLQENANLPSGLSMLIQEPFIADQNLPHVWGPDVNGVLFAVGDFYRAGAVSRTKQQNPDSALDSVDDLCPPSEPLQNGVVMDGLSFVASPNRWWAGHSGTDAAGNLKYNWVEVPVGDGLASPFGICTDGKYVYFIGKHGILRHSNGPAESLTDADLYNLFPHEGIAGTSVIYGGPNSIPAPDFTKASQFRLSVSKGFLYFDYVITLPGGRTFHNTLVMNTMTGAWQGLDTFAAGNSAIHAGTTLPASAENTYMGDADGAIWIEGPSSSEAVTATLATNEEMPDVRAQQMWGDASVDILASGGDITVTPVFLGVPFGTITTLDGGQLTRQSGLTINLLGQQLARSMGLLFSWTDTGVLFQPTTLYSWQPSFVPQPEDFTNRWDDWDDCGTPGAKFIQGCIIMADTADIPKSFAVESSEDLSLNPLLEMPFAFNGQSEVAFSLAAPFIAHLVRLIPQDSVVCRKWSCRFIFQPAPESVYNWQTQGTAHGFPGFFHAQRMIFAYSAIAPVTLTITAFDGTSPAPVTLPATGGAYQKQEFMFTPNKGRLFFYQAESAARWRPYLADCEIYLKPWGSTGPYENKPVIGDPHGDKATI